MTATENAGARLLETIRRELVHVDALIANPETDSFVLRDAITTRARLRRELVDTENQRYSELNGVAPERPRAECKACSGTGQTTCTCDTCDNDHDRPCESCSGTGAVFGEIV